MLLNTCQGDFDDLSRFVPEFVSYISLNVSINIIKVSIRFGCYIHCTGAIATRGFYSEYLLPLYMYNVSCNGEEASVFGCLHSQTNNGVPSCSQSEDAGVICQGQNVMCLMVF